MMTSKKHKNHHTGKGVDLSNIDPKYFANIKTGDELFAEIATNLLFGKSAIEDFHASTALDEGVDEYGRIFLDFSEERRLWIIQCRIDEACRRARERKPLSKNWRS